MPRRLVAVLVVILAFMSSGAVPAQARADTLPDGFQVADGTRLVGQVFPNLGAVTGWTAVFDVDTDAVTAFNAYQDQLRAAGFTQTSAACADTGTADVGRSDAALAGVVCSGVYADEPAVRVRLAVLVCRTCGEAQLVRSTGILELSRSDAADRAQPSGRAIEPVSGPTLQLTPADRAQLRRSVRAANRGNQSSPSPDWQPDYWHVMNLRLFGTSGARLVSPTTTFGDRCQPDETTVLRATGDPEGMLADLVDNLEKVSEGPWTTARSERSSEVVVQRTDGYWTLTMVDPRAGGAFILASLCSD